MPPCAAADVKWPPDLYSWSDESVTVILSPLIGRAVADIFGYSVVFGASIGFLAAALLILVIAVGEPRKRTTS